MNIKKFAASTALVGTLALGIGIVGAQDNPPPGRPGQRPIRALVDLVVEETGLEAREILSEMREGVSLADIITANGGDVSSIIEAATERINWALTEGQITQEQADRLLGNLDDALNGTMPEGRFPNRGEGRPRMQGAQALIEAAVAETGLEAGDIMEQLRDGVTLADITTANGGTIEVVIASAVADATERINNAVAEGRLTQEEADERLAALETTFTDAVNSQFPGHDGRPGARLLAHGLARQVAEATGLEMSDIVAQIRGGATVAEILTANDVDVTVFTSDVITSASERLAQAVENGRLTQERADEMIAQLTERLPEMLNSSPAIEANA
jgi:hypothetical protein